MRIEEMDALLEKKIETAYLLGMSVIEIKCFFLYEEG